MPTLTIILENVDAPSHGLIPNNALLYQPSGTSSVDDSVLMGTCTAVSFDPATGHSTITIDTGSLAFTPPGLNDFIFFSRINSHDTRDLLGYYAEVKMVNDSHDNAELFSVGTEVSASSK